MKNTKINIARKIAWEYKFYIILSLFLNITANILLCYSTLLIKNIIDGISDMRNTTEIIYPIILFVLLTSLKHLLFYLDNIPEKVLNVGIYNKTKIYALEKISNIDYQEYQNLGTGQIQQIIEKGANAVRDIIFFYLELFTNLLPTFVINLFFIAYFDSFLFLIITIIVIIIFTFSFKILKLLKKHQEEILDFEEDFTKTTIRGFMELVVFRLGNYYKKQIKILSKLNKKIIDNSVKKGLLHESFFFLFSILTLLTRAGIIYRQAILIINNTSTVGRLYAMMDFSSRILNPVAIFNVIFVNYKINVLTLERFNYLMNLKDDINIVCKSKSYEYSSQNDITFTNVSFGYTKENTILKDLSLEIKQGNFVGITGVSGSGKSTIGKLIVGLLKINKGKIKIGNNELLESDLTELYRKLEYINQDSPIFDGTIRENLSISNEYTDDVLLESLRYVGIEQLILNSELGLDTKVGERGIKLSGGERQKISLARVYLNKPEIIILDEPASGLDKKSQKNFIDTLLLIENSPTIIIITHRLDILEKTNSVIVIRDGNIDQEGTYNELIKNKGLLRELLEV